MESKQKALFVVDLARDKKAEDMVVLDMRKLSSITDFFVIVTASSARRAQAITDNIEEGLLKSGGMLSSIEGYREAKWIIIDAYDVVVHTFDSRAREFYNLESLWGDAIKVRLCQRKKKKYSKKTSKRK